MIVQRVDSLNFPSLHARLSYSGLDTWMDFVHDVYGHPIHRFAVLDGERALGALALVEVKHPAFGHYLATAPFGSYGGFAYENIAARDLLLDEVRRLAEQLGADYLCLRFDDTTLPVADGFIEDPAYLTYRIDLTADPEDLMKRLSSNQRNKVRRSLKQGHRIRFGHLELLDDVYEAIASCMHELGSPYHAKAYLQKMAEHLGESLEFMVAYDSTGHLTGGGVLIYQDDVAFMLHGNVLRHARAARTGEFLDWSGFERGMQRGCATFDLGRSLVGSGNDAFKSSWSPRKSPLAYWYWLAPGHDLPAVNQENPRYQFAIATWKRLPRFVARSLGPHIIRGLV
jgi:FemAB-related protein (PEP-CTERM system-associated)